MTILIGDRIIFTLVSIPITLVSLFWIGVLFRQLFLTARSYKLNRRSFFSDEDCKRRILYNLETHFVKYILLLILVVLELIEPLCGVFYVYNTIGHNPWYINVLNDTRVTECSVSQTIELFFSNNLCIQFCEDLDVLFLCQCMIGICVFITFLSILCRYLAARYNRHPISRTVGKYILWMCVQIILHLPGFSRYTLGLTLFNSLFIVIIDWLVLVRDSKKLRSALRLYIQELQLHLNRQPYLRERILYSTYNKCMVVLLGSVLSYAIALALLNFLHIGSNMLTNECMYSLISVNNRHYQPERIYHTFFHILYLIKWFFILLHFVLLALPLHIVTVSALVALCIKKCRGVDKQNIHFNYEIMRDLLEKQKRRKN